MQAALKSVKGVSKATVGKKVGTKADTVVTAAKSVKLNDLITVSYTHLRAHETLR